MSDVRTRIRMKVMLICPLVRCVKYCDMMPERWNTGAREDAHY
jgi:hypothetical protein